MLLTLAASQALRHLQPHTIANGPSTGLYVMQGTPKAEDLPTASASHAQSAWRRVRLSPVQDHRKRVSGSPEHPSGSTEGVHNAAAQSSISFSL